MGYFEDRFGVERVVVNELGGLVRYESSRLAGVVLIDGWILDCCING